MRVAGVSRHPDAVGRSGWDVMTSHLIQVGMAAAQRVALQLAPRRAASDGIKKGTISRAEGGQLQAPVGPRWVCCVLIHQLITRHHHQYPIFR